MDAWSIGFGHSTLSLAQCRAIHHAALEILETTGMRLSEPAALQLLQGAGAYVRDGVVHTGSSLVEQAIRTAPPRMTIFDREGRRAMSLQDRNCYFGGQSDLVNYLDPVTMTRRRLVSHDIAQLTRLVDALPNIDFTICGSEASDYPVDLVARVAFRETVLNTTKPVGFVCNDVDDLSDILDMAANLAGGAEALVQRPFIIHYAEPISPLVHYAPAIRKLLCCARRQIPVIYAPMLQAGATSPATLAGTLAQAVAESLGGLVIHQLQRPGAPFIFGAIPTHFDMRTLVLPYGAPELHLLAAAMAEMGHFYGLPVFGTAGCTDAKEIDAQAGAECALSILTSVLAGANLIHDVGLMDHATILCPDFLVYNDEVIGMVKNYTRTVNVDPEALALDVIDRVGPAGQFLTEAHTLKHFREDWYPRLFDRSAYDTWSEAGSETLSIRLRKRTEELLKTHQPKAPTPEAIRALDALQQSWL
jgi:trimethylamine---corrinoid protein Co-methyltransferase